jgi:hypothetical protein
MLASITPLGERGRRSRWSVTVGAFLIGSAVAGVVAGATLGALGGFVLPGSLSSRVRLALLAAAIAAALALDAAGRVPGPRRQVDERWLDQYRGWVYGVGYGGQLGLAVITVVSSAATYVALLAAFLAGRAAPGVVIVGSYGVVRGLTPLVAARVHSQRRLLALHRALDRWRTPARWAAVAGQVGVLVAAVTLAGV